MVSDPRNSISSSFDDRRGIPADARRRFQLLEDCREMVVTRLCAVIGDALTRIGDELGDLALRSDRRDEQRAFIDAAMVVRQNRSEIESRFRKAFVDCFERRLFKQDEAPRERAPDTELSLVDDSVINDKLSVDRLVHRARGKLDPDEVLGMRARLAALLERDWFEETQHPVAPEVIFEALKQALAELAPAQDVQTALLDAFEPHVSSQLNQMYASVNTRLKENQVLPKIRPQVPMRQPIARRAPGAPATPEQNDPRGLASPRGNGAANDRTGTSASGGSAAYGGAAGHGGPTAYGAGAGYGNPAAYGAAAAHTDAAGYGSAAHHGDAASVPPHGGTGSPGWPGESPGSGSAGFDPFADFGLTMEQLAQGAPAARESMARMLTDPDGFGVADLPLPVVQPRLIDSISHLQASTVRSHAGASQVFAEIVERTRDAGSPLDQLMVEIVSLVFDYIYADKRLSAPIKQQLLRLQVVAVKAALLDRSFFARRKHPMRRLIDRICELATDPDSNIDADGPLLVALEKLVDWVLSTFDRDLDTFEQALARLDEMGAQEATRRAERLNQLTRAAEQEEAINQALVTSKKILADRLENATPAAIRDFINDWWSRVMAHASVSHDPSSLRSAEALQVAEALIWSVTPKVPDEISRLAGLLPKLISGLTRGLRMVAMPDAPQEKFFDELLRMHTRAIDAAKHSVGQRPSAERVLSRLRMRADGTIQYTAPRGALPAGQGGSVSVTPVVVQADAAAKITGAGESAGMKNAADPAALNLQAAEHLSPSTVARTSVGGCQRGDRIEIEEGGEVRNFKLAWISPTQKLYILSRYPDESRSMDAASFASLFAAGRARVVQRHSAIDRAMDMINSDSALAAKPGSSGEPLVKHDDVAAVAD